MRNVSDELYIATDDGSYGEKDLFSDILKRLVAERAKFDLAVVIGPVPMMAAISALTKEMSIPTIVSLNSLMVDGTGMCGACRVTVGGETKFTCVDGPEFDAHKVDFKELSTRLKLFSRYTPHRKGRVRERTLKIQNAQWRTPQMPKNRMSIPRQPMPEQKPEERAKNFLEVPFGYSTETAMLEAERCLQCKNRPCVEGCPVRVQIPGIYKMW